MGGILPFFTSGKALEEFLALMKFSLDIPSMFNIFIGLEYFLGRLNYTLFSVKTSTGTFMYPHMSKLHKCCMMLQFNLSEPDWISIP